MIVNIQGASAHRTRQGQTFVVDARTQHTCDFANCSLVVQGVNNGVCGLIIASFLHAQMRIGETCNARQVCNGDNLLAVRKVVNVDRHLLTNITANARVYFVEYHTADIVKVCNDRLVGEHKSAHFATTDDFCQ